MIVAGDGYSLDGMCGGYVAETHGAVLSFSSRNGGYSRVSAAEPEPEPEPITERFYRMFRDAMWSDLDVNARDVACHVLENGRLSIRHLLSHHVDIERDAGKCIRAWKYMADKGCIYGGMDQQYVDTRYSASGAARLCHCYGN